uniref:ATP synthase F0 subunit 8 n=1 Tax=Rhodomonas salina TaxID=3034 RepID=Q9G8X2_RHDSA|nr:ATP synthase F0 subunit 8 [Rhodomonas salina]AAG17725.1 ATP synthase F0 subunit 8 [Rhodomonas salina]
MPQLDLMHFFSQFFWFSIIFVALFFYVNFNILPLLVVTLKYRSKKLISLSKKIGDSKKDVVDLRLFHDNTISRAFKTTNQKISISIDSCNKSVEEYLQTLSNDIYYNCNKNYFIFLTINNYKNFVFDKKIKNEL